MKKYLSALAMVGLLISSTALSNGIDGGRTVESGDAENAAIPQPAPEPTPEQIPAPNPEQRPEPVPEPFAEVGETAAYKLDKSRERTSSMIRKGTIDLEIVEFVAETEDGPAFKVKADYDVTIRWMGRKQGSQTLDAPEEFFTPEFLERVRTEGEVSYPKFKVKHLGYEDATTMDGNEYPQCDKLLIYDIDTTRPESEFGLMVGALTGKGMREIEDLEIRALVTEDIPVIGAAKIDVSGKSGGVFVKAGGDYIAEAIAQEQNGAVE